MAEEEFEGPAKKHKHEFLELDEHDETPEEFTEEIAAGERDADVYTEEGREVLREESAIEDWEEGWVEGAEEKGELGVCARCGKPLSQKDEEIVEREIDHEIYFFCSNECAEKGPKKD